MSQEQQQRRPQQNEDQQQRSQGAQREPIKYGDVFVVSGELANKPVAPRDAAMMQAAESTAFGQTQRGGPADVMTCAAEINEQAGLVGRGDVTDIAKDKGVTITGTEVPGARVVTESFAGQVIGQHVQVAAEQAAATAGDKPVEYSDAAAVAEAEIRATGRNLIMQGGYAASAQSAAAYNTGMIRDDNKIKIRDVLAGASKSFPAKEVTRDDAEAVARAEQRNNPNLTTYPGGISSSMDTASRLNQDAGMQ
ncbi:hypothetical protein ACOSQ3_007841 [Xanthoceras sorbifolium]